MPTEDKKKRRTPRKIFTGVQFKFIGLTTALVIVLLALLNYYPVRSSRDLIFSEKQTAMTNQASSAASSLASLDRMTRDSIAEVINLLDLNSYQRILVCTDKKRVVYDTATEGNRTGQLNDLDMVSRALSGRISFHSSFTEEAFSSQVSVPVVRDADVIGAVYLDELDRGQAGIITGIQRRIRAISAFICILALVADILMTRVLTKRIVTLSEMTKRVADGDYSARFEVEGEDEVAELGKEFNSLTRRLEATEKQRRQFVSDASHELKTPIAAISLLADSIVQNEDMDMATVREFVSDIAHEGNRMQRISEELLDLSRLDDSAAAKPSVPVDMREVAEEAVALLKPLAEEKKVTIHLELEEDCNVLATEDDLYHVVFNLVENAIKYNVENGEVFVKLCSVKDRVWLYVEDTGIGIPEGERQAVFDRFYRVDKARSREAGGSGLGLSIVHDAVKRHRGTIEVTGMEPRGTIFAVSLPKGPPILQYRNTLEEETMQ